MDRYQETLETWNKVASLYQEKFMDLDLYNESYDFICDSIPKINAKILEIGCGPGNITRYLLAKRPDFHIHGIDIAPNMIALAKANNPTANFSVLDARSISQLDKKFDGIICGFSIPYLSGNDCKQLISAVAGLLNTDGFIYISFVEGDPAQSGFKSASTGDRSYFYYHALDELKIILLENNFDFLKLFKVEYEKSETIKETHTILTALKKQIDS